MDAYKHALTNRLAIIQGPPGTFRLGKEWAAFLKKSMREFAPRRQLG
jgi:hypothetical protein